MLELKGMPTGAAPAQQTATELLDALEERARCDQHQLARRVNVDAEVLTYLAEHGGVATRMAVAANRAAPPCANECLCNDEEVAVRAELARKIARLLPDLQPDEACSLRDHCIELLEKLARDQAPRVRALLAEEIKRLDCVPKSVVMRLARDVEDIVAAPILEFSPLLSDPDLIEIIAGAQLEHTLTAVARRQPLSADVCDAVVGSLEVPALAALLANPNAAIRAETLDTIINSAENLSVVHEPLVFRSELSVRTIRRLASFVGTALLERLSMRDGLDEKTHDILNQRLHARLLATDDDPGDARCAELVTDEEMAEGAARRGDRAALVTALARLAQVPAEAVRRILNTAAPNPMIALIWKAGLSMRMAYSVQVSIMHLPPSERIAARGGKDFPLTKEEMAFQLGIFGIPPPENS